MISNFDEFMKWKSTTKEGVETCKCERCGKEFQIKKAYGKGSFSSPTFYKVQRGKKLICPSCKKKESFRKTIEQKSDEQKRLSQEKRVEARKKTLENQHVEDSSKIYKTYEELSEDYKQRKLQAANVVCEGCGKVLYLKDRQTVYRYIKNHDRLLCKGCGISKTQSLIHAEKRSKGLYETREDEYIVSGEENELTSYIKSIYNGEIILNSRSLVGFELDIYLPDLKLAFEYDGSYWHSYKNKYYHLDKTILCERRGIKLIHVWDAVWKSQPDFIKGIIKDNIEGKKINSTEDIIILDRRYYSTLDKPENYFILYKTEPTVYYSNCRTIKKDYSVTTPYSLFDCGNIIFAKGNKSDYIQDREFYLNFIDLEVPEEESPYYDYYKSKFDNYLSLGTTDINKIKEIVNEEIKKTSD